VALPDWALISGIVATAVGSIVAAFRVKPEARKFRDDGAAGLVTSAGAFMSGVEHEMAALRGEVQELRTWRRGLEGRLRRHSRWDDAMVAAARGRGEQVPDPPKLFDDDEEGEVTAHGASA
jgi:hypothetical protein